MLHIENEFRQPLSMDEAPEGSVCEWCGKPARHQFIVLGGKCSNESAFFAVHVVKHSFALLPVLFAAK